MTFKKFLQASFFTFLSAVFPTVGWAAPGDLIVDNNSADNRVVNNSPPSPDLNLSLPVPSETSKLILQAPWWFNLGLGIGAGSQSNNGLAGDVSLNYAVTQNQFVSFRAVGVNNTAGISGSHMGVALSGNLLHVNDMVGGIGDLGPMYGVRSVQSWGYYGASAGVAMATGRRSPTGSQNVGNDFTTVGLPLEAEAFYDINNHLAFGLIGFADVNPQASFVGITLAVELGRLVVN